MDSAPTSSLICKLVVYPFTTIQWLEHHLLHQTSHDMREEDFVGDDASKVELFMNGQRIPSEITIYEAIHRFGNINGEKIFDIEHVIKLQKQTAGDGPVNRKYYLIQMSFVEY